MQEGTAGEQPLQTHPRRHATEPGSLLNDRDLRALGREPLDQLAAAALSDSLAAFLRTARPSADAFWKVAKVLSVVNQWGLQPSAACQEQVAAWVCDAAAAGFTIDDRGSGRWTARSLLHAWLAFAMQPGSAAGAALPALLQAVRACFPALQADGGGMERMAAGAAFAAVCTLRSAAEAHEAFAATSHVWNVFCTIAALRSLSQLCASHCMLTACTQWNSCVASVHAWV